MVGENKGIMIVSACLAGFRCRYDYKFKSDKRVIKLVRQGKAIPICPEQLGGLPTPRVAAERVGNKLPRSKSCISTVQGKPTRYSGPPAGGPEKFVSLSPSPPVGGSASRNKVLRKDGVDVTKEFSKGAKEALRIAKLVGCKKAILKARSPSCGSGKVYDGTFSGTLIDGDGVCAELFKKNGIEVVTEEQI